jgi:hypothetical protein
MLIIPRLLGLRAGVGAVCQAVASADVMEATAVVKVISAKRAHECYRAIGA